MRTLNLVAFLLLTVTISACAAPEPPQPTATLTPTATRIPASPTLIPATETALPATDTPVPTEVQGATVSFANDVLPIFRKTCLKCHGLQQIKEGMDLRTYQSLMAGSFNGAVIVAGDIENSYLVELVRFGEMPKRGSELSPEQIQVIVDWVEQGALDN